MIIAGSTLLVADNSGAKRVRCIKVLKSKRWASIGDIIVVSVIDSIPNPKTVKMGGVYKAVIVRTKKEMRRKDGSYIRFDTNSAVLIHDGLDPIATRVFGVIPRELRGLGYTKIISLAQGVM